MEKSKEPSVFLIPENSSIELNFQPYYFDQESAVFIPPGQFIATDEQIKRIAVDHHSPKNYRYLFSQVLTLGHVGIDEKIKSAESIEVLDYSTKKWKELNPFNSNDEELDMLFDTSDWLDRNVEASLDLKKNPLSYHEIQKLSKEKLQLTLFQWKNHKLVNQARQKLYETGGSVKETTYALGFKDTSYFCRFFRNNTSLSPKEFVQNREHKPREKSILKDFKHLVDNHIQTEHYVSFYASELSLTTKNLSNIIKSISGTSPKKHIQAELLARSKSYLKKGHSITDITFQLGFEEISHFSNFFKFHTGITPSDFNKESTVE